jgi:hypothetical protein
VEAVVTAVTTQTLHRQVVLAVVVVMEMERQLRVDQEREAA